ncbi:MAG TPA: 3-oxoacyl-[acyl-carrier-protein] synthase III C-terminal domain-containing protein [Polyangiaceae bacterium]
MSGISLLGAAGYAPETVIDNAFFEIDAKRATSGMFKGSRERRHVAKGETAVSMIQKATEKLQGRLGFTPSKDVDLILTNVSCPDSPFTGCGASVARTLGAKPKWVLDLHNSGCVSFVYMLGVARELMASGAVKSALLCCAQTAAGRVFSHPENRVRPQSCVPGDGCGVGYVVANDEAPVRGIVQRSYGDYADDMVVKCDEDAEWWAPHRSSLYIDFTESRIASIVSRGNQLVPAMVNESCKASEVRSQDLDLLITNQPNTNFLRNWREALLLPKEKHLDTFEEYGNLFGAAIPINIERAMEKGLLKKGARVALGGFAHAGDYAAAAIWQPPSA